MFLALLLLLSAAPRVWYCKATSVASQLFSQCASSASDGRLSCVFSTDLTLRHYNAEAVPLPQKYVSVDGCGSAVLDLTGTTQLLSVPDGATLALSNIFLTGVELAPASPPPNINPDLFLVPRAFLLAPGSRLVLRNVSISTPSVTAFWAHQQFACQASPSPNFSVFPATLTIHLLSTPAAQLSDVRLACSAPAAPGSATPSAPPPPPCIADTVRSGRQLVDALMWMWTWPTYIGNAPSLDARDRLTSASARSPLPDVPIYLHVPHDITFAGVDRPYTAAHAAAVPEPITSRQVVIAGPAPRRTGSATATQPPSSSSKSPPDARSAARPPAPPPAPPPPGSDLAAPIGGPEVDLAWLAYALPLHTLQGHVELQDLTLTNLPFGSARDNPAGLHSAFVWVFDLMRWGFGSATGGRRLVLHNVRLRVESEELAGWAVSVVGGALPPPPPLDRTLCSFRSNYFASVFGSMVDGAGADGGPALLVRNGSTRGGQMVLEDVLITDERSPAWPGRRPRCGSAGLADPDLYVCTPVSSSTTAATANLSGVNSSAGSSSSSGGGNGSGGVGGNASAPGPSNVGTNGARFNGGINTNGVGAAAGGGTASTTTSGGAGAGASSSNGPPAVGMSCECRPPTRLSSGGGGGDAASARSHPLCMLAPANLREVTAINALSVVVDVLDSRSFIPRMHQALPRLVLRTSVSAATATEDPRDSLLTSQATVTLPTTLLGDLETPLYVDFLHGAAASISVRSAAASLTLRAVVLVNLPAAAPHPAAAAAAALTGNLSAPLPLDAAPPPNLQPTQGLPSRLSSFKSCVWPLLFDRAGQPLTEELGPTDSPVVGEPGSWASASGGQRRLPRAYLESVTVVVPAAEAALLAWMVATNSTDVVTDPDVAEYVGRTLLGGSRLAGGDAARRWLVAAVAAAGPRPCPSSSAAGGATGAEGQQGGGQGNGSSGVGRLTFAQLEWCGLYGRNVTFATAPLAGCAFPAAPVANSEAEALRLPADYCRASAAMLAALTPDTAHDGGAGAAVGSTALTQASPTGQVGETSEPRRQHEQDSPQQQREQEEGKVVPLSASSGPQPLTLSLANSPAPGSATAPISSSDLRPPVARRKRPACVVGTAVAASAGLALLGVGAAVAGFLCWRRGGGGGAAAAAAAGRAADIEAELAHPRPAASPFGEAAMFKEEPSSSSSEGRPNRRHDNHNEGQGQEEDLSSDGSLHQNGPASSVALRLSPHPAERSPRDPAARDASGRRWRGMRGPPPAGGGTELEASRAGAGAWGSRASNGRSGGSCGGGGDDDPRVGYVAAGLSGWTSWLLGLTGDYSARGGRYVGGAPPSETGTGAGVALGPGPWVVDAGARWVGRWPLAGRSDGAGGGGGGGGGGAFEGSSGLSEPGPDRCSLPPAASSADLAKDLAQLYERVDRLREGLAAGPPQARVPREPQEEAASTPPLPEQHQQQQEEQEQLAQLAGISAWPSPSCTEFAAAAAAAAAAALPAPAAVAAETPEVKGLAACTRQQQKQKQQFSPLTGTEFQLREPGLTPEERGTSHAAGEAPVLGAAASRGGGGGALCTAVRQAAGVGAGSAPDRPLWGIGALHVEGVLGCGARGVVYRGEWRGLRVAVKSFLFSEVPRAPGAVPGSGSNGASSASRRALQEAALCLFLHHPNIVATYTYSLQPLTAAAGGGGGGGGALRARTPPPPRQHRYCPATGLMRNPSQNLSGLESLLDTQHGGGDGGGGGANDGGGAGAGDGDGGHQSISGRPRPDRAPTPLGAAAESDPSPPAALRPPPARPPAAAVLRRQPASLPNRNPSQDLEGLESLLGPGDDDELRAKEGPASALAPALAGSQRRARSPPSQPPPPVEAWRLALVQEHCDGRSLRHTLGRGTLSAPTAGPGPELAQPPSPDAAAPTAPLLPDATVDRHLPGLAGLAPPPPPPLPSPPVGSVLLLALDIARGMSHLHQYGVVHGNLSSSNVLLASWRRPPQRRTAGPLTPKSFTAPAESYVVLDGTAVPYRSAASDGRRHGVAMCERREAMAGQPPASECEIRRRSRTGRRSDSSGSMVLDGPSMGDAALSCGLRSAPVDAEAHCAGLGRADPSKGRRALRCVEEEEERYREACGVGYVAKLCDFGAAGRLSEQRPTHLSGSVRRLSLYSAPELACGGSSSRATDVYAFAIVLWELASGLPLPLAMRAAPQLRDWMREQSAAQVLMQLQQHAQQQQAQQQQALQQQYLFPAGRQHVEDTDQQEQQHGQQGWAGEEEKEEEKGEEEEVQPQLLSAFAALRPELLPWPPGIPEAVVQLAGECLRGQPSQRPTFADICAQLDGLVRREAVTAAATVSWPAVAATSGPAAAAAAVPQAATPP